MSGTTTYLGITYPTSTDYVKDGATAMQTIATGFDSAVAIPTYNNQTGTTYTFGLVDAAKVVSSNNGSAVTFTIPPQSSVTWTTGATLTVTNFGAGSVTIAGGSGVTVTNAGATVGQYGSASIIRTGSDAWTVIPFAGGAALLSDSAISGTTGSPTTATYTDGGINYKTYAFTGSGSITLSKGGLVDCLVVAGGGGGKTNWGGGGGGSLIQNQIYLPAATHTITVGAGGSYTSNLGIGAISAIGLGTNTYLNSAIGGGSATGTVGNYGACGSGGNGAGFQGLAINSNLGYDGGTSTSTNHAGGGGGIGGAAPNIGTANVGGAGGIGLNNSFRTGSNIGYGGGGGGGGSTTGGASGGFGGGAGGNTATSATAGTANTGGGGGGAWAGGAAVSANGGSGLVVVRVKA